MNLLDGMKVGYRRVMVQPLPLVLQLQSDALGHSNLPISSLLRKAKAVAVKLQVNDALNWIDKELNGYSCAARDLPEYRRIRGQPKAFDPYRGWLPLMIKDEELSDMICQAPLFQSAGALEELSRGENDSSLQFRYSDSHMTILMKIFNHHSGEFMLFLQRASVWSVVDTVKTLVLDWTLELELAGVKGERMSFTQTEKDRGTSVTNNYFAQNIGVAGSVSDQATVTNTQSATSGTVDLVRLQYFLSQLQEVKSTLPPFLHPTVDSNIYGIQAELSASVPDNGKIRTMLGSIKTTCEGAAGNLVASGVVEMIKHILGS